MTQTIAIAGKGGTGKTTISALLVDYLRANKKGHILAIDADPNTNLNQALGIELKETMVGILDKVSALKDNLPAGMTKDRYIEYQIQSSLTEADGFDLLAMGRPEGPGCYCYANSVLRGIIDKLSNEYDYLVIDNEAGMEHLSRRTTRIIDAFFIISDFSKVGIRCAKRISELAKQMELKIKKEYLIVNLTRPDIEPLKDDIRDSGIDFIGNIPFDENIENSSLNGISIIDPPMQSKSTIAFRQIMSRIL